jgi:hypothetical protein
MTQTRVCAKPDQPDRIRLPLTWSTTPAAMRRQVDQLVVEPGEDGLIISLVEADLPLSPPHTPRQPATCVAYVAVSADNLLDLIKLLQKAYLAHLCQKIQIVKAFRS